MREPRIIIWMDMPSTSDNKDFQMTQPQPATPQVTRPKPMLPFIIIKYYSAKFLLDTGSAKSFISPKLANQHFKDKICNEPFEIVGTHAISRHNGCILVPLYDFFQINNEHKFYIFSIAQEYDGLKGWI